MERFLNDLHEFNFLIAVTIFFVYILIDGLYAYYTLAVAEKRPFISATSDAFIHFLTAFGVLNYVQNYLYIVPLALGSWIGTYIIVKMSPAKALEK